MDQQNNNCSPAPAPQLVQQQQYQQQVPQGQPQCMQPPVQQYAQPAGYTGGQKAAWLFIGLLTGVAGILLGNVVNVDNPVRRSEAMKFAAIGFVIVLVLWFLIFATASCSTAALLGSSSSYYSYR